MYGRFLVHSLEDAGRANLIRLAADGPGASGGELFLEFRTGKDLGQEHLFGDDHFRQFIDPMVVELEIEELGGEVTYREEGCGLATYKTEDPHVARIVAHFPARVAPRSDPERTCREQPLRGEQPRHPRSLRRPRGRRRPVRRRADLVLQPRSANARGSTSAGSAGPRYCSRTSTGSPR